MKWEKSKYYGRNVYDVVAKKSPGVLTEPDDIRLYAVPNLRTFAAWLRTYLEIGKRITVVADYDCDGVCSGTILQTIFRAFGRNDIEIILPRRQSDGYGLSMGIIERISCDVLITIDNGIAAIDAIKEAKRRGMVVMVMDHHEPGEELPPADIIVDPHVDCMRAGFLKEDAPDKGFPVFEHFCAAGLAYALALCIGIPEIVADRCAGPAAIATIADVVPLVGANRGLYRKGIGAIREGRMTEGLKALIDSLKSNRVIDTESIGFKIAPMLNAPGRILDSGANISFALLTSDDEDEARRLLDQVNSLNEQRKLLKRAAKARANLIIEREQLQNANPLVIVDPKTHPGVIGLTAGEFCEQDQVTTFAFTVQPDGSCKGSARACDGDNVFEALSECKRRNPDILLGFGGHEKAAGCTVAPGMMDKFREVMHDIMGERHEKKDTLFYDMEIETADIPWQVGSLERYEPYGEGNPRPVFKIRDFMLSPKNGNFFVKGKAGLVRFYGKDCSAIGFWPEGDIFEENRLMTLNIVGTLNRHIFNDLEENQINIIDLEEVKKDVTKNKLITSVGDNLPDGVSLSL